MIMPNIKTDNLSCRELADTINRLNNLTTGGNELYKRNKVSILPLLKKLLQISKRENEWYIYFYGLYAIMYELLRCGDLLEVIKYAEVFYRDSALMDKELPNYPDTNMAEINIWIYSMIYFPYSACHQIDDAKMSIFMHMYEDAALKYGRTFDYYKDEMKLGILYRDIDLVKHGKKYFEQYERNWSGCYVCGHKQFLGYYLLLGEIDMAEELMQIFIHRQIPKQYQWCYEYCQEAETSSLYVTLLEDCLTVGNPAAFRYFYEKYWSTLPREEQRSTPDIWNRTSRLFFCAIAGDFKDLESDIHEAENDVKESCTFATLDLIEEALQWMCYFWLLDHYGISQVLINLPGLQEDGLKKSSLSISSYFEHMADDAGSKFQLSRAKFDYQLLKDTYYEVLTYGH